MSEPPGGLHPHHALLAALEAADAPTDPARPSAFARDRAEYAEALHLAAPAHSRAITHRTLQRVAAFAITATAMLAIGLSQHDPRPPVFEGEVEVQAWKVTGGGAELLGPRDRVEQGDMLQLSVTSTQPRRVNVWVRDAEGAVEAWFGAEGVLVGAGERVPLKHHTLFGAQPGTLQVAVQVCAATRSPGTDPWSDVLPPEGCRPFLFSLKSAG